MTDTNRTDYKALYPILFCDRWPASGLKNSIVSVDADALAEEYRRLCKNAPRRSKSYFSLQRNGTTDERHPATRGIQWEPRYAMALWNLESRWPRPCGGWQRFLDYQTPLQARQADSGIGEIDLFGVTDRGRLIVVELKYPRIDRQGNSPAYALMEGLRYAAIVEANQQPIAIEAKRKLGVKQVDSKTPPIVQVLGPISWWDYWLKKRAAGNWSRSFAKLASAFETRTGVTVECLATDTDIESIVTKLCKRKPSLNCPPKIYSVQLNREGNYFEALSPVDWNE